jgi:hypothetical protein
MQPFMMASIVASHSSNDKTIEWIMMQHDAASKRSSYQPTK